MGGSMADNNKRQAQEESDEEMPSNQIVGMTQKKPLRRKRFLKFDELSKQEYNYIKCE